MKTRLLASMLLAGAACAASPAAAAIFVWNSGAYVPGVTSPTPLIGPDVLQIVGGSNKLFDAAAFTNQSGTVQWDGGAIFFVNGGSVTNNGLWNATGDQVLADGAGAQGSFVNTGIFRKSGGFGQTQIGSIGFVNSGVIDAQTGSIRFTGPGATFNAGSAFTGAGFVDIGADATFNGGFTASNLVFSSGVFTGNGAALDGMAQWNFGTFAGDWTVTGGSQLTVAGGGNKVFGAGSAIANDGTVVWNAGTIFFGDGATVQNSGLWLTTTDQVLNDGAGAPGQFVNTGTFRKDGGAGVTSIGAVNFTNNGGTIDAATGIIRFTGSDAVFNDGTSFIGAGVNEVASNAAFNGGISATNLFLSNGTMTGTAAVLTGIASWGAGAMAGDWTIASGSEFIAGTGSNKVFAGGSFTNDGTVTWDAGTLILVDGAAIANTGLWLATGDLVLADGAGPNGQFVNTGTFRKDGGAGVTSVAAVNFTNNGGVIDAVTGTIRFTGGDAVFNSGTSFTGAGVNDVFSNATFNGAISATNLVVQNGVFTGGSAVLSGQAAWASGSFSGDWTIAGDGTLTGFGGSNKLLTAVSLTNDGTILWTGGTLFFTNGSVLTNNGTMDFSVDTTVAQSIAPQGSIVNNGLILKSGGAGFLNLNSGVALDNQGTIDVRSGTILLPTSFENDGTLTGDGAFQLTGTLTNNGTIAPGVGVGTLSLNGVFEQTGSGTMVIELASSSLADLFLITGAAQLGGTLALSCVGGCAIANGDVFTILDSAGPLSGVFANVTTSGFLNGFDFDVIYDYDADRVLLSVLDIGRPGGVDPIPEPATWAMMIAGFGLAGIAARRRKRPYVIA